MYTCFRLICVTNQPKHAPGRYDKCKSNFNVFVLLFSRDVLTLMLYLFIICEIVLQVNLTLYQIRLQTKVRGLHVSWA